MADPPAYPDTGGVPRWIKVFGIELIRSLRASPIFSLVVLVTLGVLGSIGLMTFLMILQPGFMGMAHFSEPHHRVHDLTFGFLIATGVVGLLAQLRRPSENVAGQQMALIPWVSLALASALTNRWVFAPLPILGALTFLATVLHPTGRGLFRSFSVSRVNRVMLALVIIAAVPLLVFASTYIELQRTLTNDHAALGHYGFMAAFSLTVILASLLASLRPTGWRLTAWVTGALAAALGLASLVFQNVDSSLGLVWGPAAIAWGGVFVAAAELTQAADRTLPGSRSAVSKSERVRPDRGSTAGRPHWVKVLGIIAILVVIIVGLLFLVMHLTGGGFTHLP